MPMQTSKSFLSTSRNLDLHLVALGMAALGGIGGIGGLGSIDGGIGGLEVV